MDKMCFNNKDFLQLFSAVIGIKKYYLECGSLCPLLYSFKHLLVDKELQKHYIYQQLDSTLKIWVCSACPTLLTQLGNMTHCSATS